MENRRTFLRTASAVGITGFVPLACSPPSREMEPNQAEGISESISSGQMQAVYVNEESKVTISLEQIDVLIKDHIPVNFPWMMEFEDKPVLGYGRGRHGGPEGETRPIDVSTDNGKTWTPLPPDSPFEPASAEAIKAGKMNVPVESSGLHGYLSDGTTLYVDTFADGFMWQYGTDPHVQSERLWSMEITEPRFRTRRFSSKGDLMEVFDMKLVDLPYPMAHLYELYGEMVELENGDILAPFLVHVPPQGEGGYTTVIARSNDGGKTIATAKYHIAGTFPSVLCPDYEVIDPIVIDITGAAHKTARLIINCHTINNKTIATI